MYASVTPYRLLRVDFLLTALLVALIVAVFLFALFGGNLAWAAESAPAVGSTVAVTTPTAVAIPYGDVVTQFLAWARDGLVALAALAVTRYAPPMVGQYLTNELLAKAIDFAIARVDGAVKGGQIEVPVANAVLKQAADYVVANAPGRAKALGDMLMPKLLARLSAATVLPATPVVLPPAPPVDGAKAAVLKSHAWLALPLAVALILPLAGCDPTATLSNIDASVQKYAPIVGKNLVKVGDILVQAECSPLNGAATASARALALKAPNRADVTRAADAMAANLNVAQQLCPLVAAIQTSVGAIPVGSPSIVVPVAAGG